MKKLLLSALFACICTLACAQDHIVLRNAEEINGKVLRISSTEVEYRKAENPDGPIYTLPVGDILFVKYENGKKEVFAEAAHNPKLVTGAGPATMSISTTSFAIPASNKTLATFPIIREN